MGLLVTLLVLSAFFSGSETALMSLNRYAKAIAVLYSRNDFSRGPID
jgi:Mg2+/Co2+ transporter CorB